MSEGFMHSSKVPRIYKVSAKVIKSVREEGGSLKSLIFEKRHPNVNGIYALTLNTLKRGQELDYLLRKTGILINEPRLDPWLARVLITELLWGKQKLLADCKPINTILSYEKALRDEMHNIPIQNESLKSTEKVKKPRYLRINTLLLSINGAISYFQDNGWELLSKPKDYSRYLEILSRLSDSFFLQDFHIPELFAFPPNTNFFYDEYYKYGKLILQDKASCLPSYLLNPPPGSSVLDMCAAPGMKATHLAAILQNKGTVYAAEIDKRRFEVLSQQLGISHATCVVPFNQDALTLNENQCPNIEYILVDPSCSGSGMIDRPKFETDDKADPRRLKRLQSFQVILLKHALLNFSSVKRVVYSTCSIHPEENEEVLNDILRDIKGSYKLLNTKELLNNNWKNFSSKSYDCGELCLYARPEIDKCNGFFVAVFERDFNVPLPKYKRKTEKRLSNCEDNDVAEETAVHADITDERDENIPKKKKKRGKRKHKIENADNDEMVEECTKESIKQMKFDESIEQLLNSSVKIIEEAVDSSELPRQKKKKKKKKERDSLEETELENSENLKKKAKIKKSKDVEEGEKTAENLVTVKSKKKKSKRKNEEGIQYAFQEEPGRK
ncbi:28S rRNA (cytosine-C(5))-methyltransferase [Prorops nasuta]|uniref:28S rRNA (cytosine-C(5))-methyltransferase n=1 Tax=Prorops nasuta TaxID=863751 RepID=UPI0034CF762E